MSLTRRGKGASCCAGHGEDHSRLREGQTCIPRTWASLVAPVCVSLGGTGWEREEGAGPGRLGKLRSGVRFALRAQPLLEGCRQDRTRFSFYKTQSAFGVEKGASFGAREKAVFQARGDGGLGQGAAVEVERVGSSESYFECVIRGRYEKEKKKSV